MFKYYVDELQASKGDADCANSMYLDKQHCTTSQKVMGLIHDGVIGIFH